MSTPGSITVWAQNLSDDDPAVRNDAAREIWERYSAPLLVLVRQKLAERVRRRVDEDDVLQSVYQSFCQNQKEHPYVFKDRNDVWAMLFRIAMWKAAGTAKHHTAGCRDVSRDRSGSPEGPDDSLASLWLLENVAAKSEPDPAKIAELNDQLEWLLRRLPEDQRQIVLWKLEGYTHLEISRMIHRTERTVELRWERICRRLKALALEP